MNVIITEQQLDIIKSLVESDALVLGDSDIPEYGDNEKVSIGATIVNKEGDEELSEPTYADEISAELAYDDPRNSVITRFY